ncbi:TPA: hypothetical protein N0H37_005618 [Pseudomonas aeruginosa]|uniref:hypothetical protein n=1 Tax=Pseudomonas TaxID=286 RepID=UPI0002CA12F0|nr:MULTISPECIES: hypothetical protein [Pseudomonas]EMZ44847.1 hypothetical protein HMPREF1224_11727 [Pseudomonas sp. P179]KSP23568.1 hypothetical protein APB10_16525 [Pseudomonas aeruginosa]RUJ69088.1 hypothetical protein IPC325_31980 [Pseudomonas aeruginosa]HBP6359831.1 hypothetical protein [Pseudomonas aeruginosa]HCE5821793.1 hypothetical protein [Pseudomonas aeruginosa]
MIASSFMGMSAALQNTSALTVLLKHLAESGWLPHEVLRGSEWLYTPDVTKVQEKILCCDPPVIRLLQNGSNTALIRLDWGESPSRMVVDYTKSWGFEPVIQQALASMNEVDAGQ